MYYYYGSYSVPYYTITNCNVAVGSIGVINSNSSVCIESQPFVLAYIFVYIPEVLYVTPSKCNYYKLKL